MRRINDDVMITRQLIVQLNMSFMPMALYLIL